MNTEPLIQQLKACGAITFGHFVLTSGATSDYYIDIKKASTQPSILREIAKHLSKHTTNHQMIAGMELGAVPLAVALALQTNLPYVIIRKEKRDHGTGKQIEGADVSGQHVLIVEDVTTSGGSVVKTIQILREHNAVVDTVLSVVDRESGTREKLTDLNVTFIPLISVHEILKNKPQEKK